MPKLMRTLVLTGARSVQRHARGRWRVAHGARIAMAMLCAGCAVDAVAPANGGRVVFLSLVPVAITLESGDTTRLVAAPRDSVGNIVPVRAAVSWRSDDSLVARVDSTGLVLAVGAGETRIAARVAGVEGRATIRVVHPEVRSSYSEVSAGGAHTCALTTYGSVMCWGLNTEGQLGNGSFASADRPVTVSGEVRAVALGTGTRHTCVAVQDGVPLCWGWNSVQQLGQSFMDKRSALPQPAAMGGRFTIMGGGSGHTCALRQDGAVLCWGSDAVGQIGGDGGSGVVRVVAGGHAFVDLAVGWVHNCAVDTDGEAWCWGWNGFGQLGPRAPLHECAANVPCAETPVSVSAMARFRTVAAGFGFSCAIDVSGAAWCWGSNAEGSLGAGPHDDSASPVRVAGGHRFNEIDAGRAHTCAVTDTGQVWCWGANESGQLGDLTRTPSPTPVLVPPGAAPARAVSAGAAHTCAVLADASIRCWGHTADGRLGPFTD